MSGAVVVPGLDLAWSAAMLVRWWHHPERCQVVGDVESRCILAPRLDR